MNEHDRVGVCPKCGSTNTVIRTCRGVATDEPGTYKGYGYETVAFGFCQKCGYQDMRISGADYDMVVDQARRAWDTQYVFDRSPDEGLPTQNDIAWDLSILMKAICHIVPDCQHCPLTSSYAADEPDDPWDAGFFVKRSKCGLTCSSQGFSDACRGIADKYPALPIDF